MASDNRVMTRKLAATTTDKVADFGSPPINKLYIHADTDTVVIDFDQPTDSTSYLIKGSLNYGMDVNCNKLYYKTTTSTANLYIVAIRYDQ